MLTETELRARQKFDAALYRRRLYYACPPESEIARQMASLARQARRDAMADIAEIRRQVEREFSARDAI